MKTVDEIMKSASLSGACSKSNGVSDWKSLVWLFFTPQGREFCEENNFPSLEMFREMSSEVAAYGVYVDAGVVNVRNKKVALIGGTEAELVFTDNTKVHKVILMHGAKARITASNYAVILLVNVGNCEVEINKDETVVIL
ncbi:hypothetical protein [uncultured Bacteroides sp.]|jgi:hypothetical protein|uniref:hypothetical protein n=1 Tax=uncultured Bacteroides sp. TaxID=162156 RepID=UPI0020561479|nr:hypothetical protein [uncultured Bacteroides sp.]DAN67499.1 MAG TPA: hypothetical protein [Caudoviricetes sp.]